MAAFLSLWQSQVRSLGFPFPFLPALAPWGRPCKAQAVAVSVLRHPLALLCLPLPPRVRPWPPPWRYASGPLRLLVLGSTWRCAYCLWLFCGARLVRVPCPSPGPLPPEFICHPFAGLPALPWASHACPRRRLPPGKGCRLCSTKHRRVPFASLPLCLHSLRRYEGPCNALVEAAQCPPSPLAMLCPSSPFPSLFPPRSRPWPPPSRCALGF